MLSSSFNSLPFVSTGTSLCHSADRCTNIPRSASATAAVCGEFKGLDALCPGGWWTEAKAGLPLPGHAGRVFPVPQQTRPGALAPWRGDTSSGGSDFGIDFPLCTLDHLALASTHFAKVIDLSNFILDCKPVDINLYKRAVLHGFLMISLINATLCSPDQYFCYTPTLRRGKDRLAFPVSLSCQQKICQRLIIFEDPQCPSFWELDPLSLKTCYRWNFHCQTF